MSVKENTISYQTTNTYSTLNTLNHKTKNVWIACHGIGYLSKYFIRYFKKLKAEENYVICPQAPSKYYLGNKYTYVGASWLTKVDTLQETENVVNYLSALFEQEKKAFENKRFILMGYSQGVSVAMRWMSRQLLPCDDLIIHSGSIPNELIDNDFEGYKNTRVHLIYGNRDEYIYDEKLNHQLKFAKSLFPHQLKIHEFEGVHEVHTGILNEIAELNL